MENATSERETIRRPRDEVDAALEAWARWGKRALAEVGWPSENILTRVIRLGLYAAAHQTGVRALEIDAACEAVDRALLRLQVDERSVVVRQYWYHETLEVTARELDMGYQRARNLFVRGRRSVADYLDGARLVFEQNRC